MPTLSVISPVYNEAEVIAEFHDRLARALATPADRYTLDVLFVLLDCDLQHPPELIPALVEEFEKGTDIVYTIREDGAGTGLLKRLTSRLFYRFVNTLSHIPIQEGAADYRLISRRVAAVFKTQIRERNQFLRGLFIWVGFHRGPRQAAIVVGFLFALSGLVLAVVTIWQYFFLAKLPPGWATLVILLAVFNGTQLIFLGIIGEYIGSIFDEVKGRPLYIVEEKVNCPGA